MHVQYDRKLFERNCLPLGKEEHRQGCGRGSDVASATVSAWSSVHIGHTYNMLQWVHCTECNF